MSWNWIEVPVTQHDEVNLGDLKVDQAYLNISTDQELSLYSLSDDCYRCPFTWISSLNGSDLLKVSTKFGMTWRLYDGRISPEIEFHDTDDMSCEARPKNYGQFGIYSIMYEEGKCTVETQLRPVNVYLPLLLIGLGLLLLSLVFSIASYIRSKCIEKEETSTSSKRRVVALDTFRGISIALMIFVNNGGGGYWFFSHATWNGLQVADLVFPWFMWIMGVCIPIAIGSQIKKGSSRGLIFVHVIKRTLILFLLGVALNTVGVGPELSTIRIMGVLQRLAICYFVVATIVTFLTYNFNISDGSQNNAKPGLFSDLLHLLPHWIFILLVFACHCYITFFFQVPRCPKGYLGPGGIEQEGAYKNCTGGATGYLDRMILGVNHIYQHPTPQNVYLTGPFDPEGLIGCLTSIVQVFLGCQAGVILMYYQRVTKAVMTRWLIWAFILGVLGLVLCQARQDGGWIPVNKNLWSFSFVCVTSCFAYFLLAFLFYVIDVKKAWGGGPFVYPGMNATILFVGHEVCSTMFPWRWSLGPMNTHFILTLENLWGAALWIVISYWLYRVKFFLAL